MSKKHNRNGHSYLTDLVSAVLSSANAKSPIVNSTPGSSKIQTDNVIERSRIHNSSGNMSSNYLSVKNSAAAFSSNQITRVAEIRNADVVDTEIIERKRALDNSTQYPNDKKPRNALEQFVKMNRLLQTTEKLPARRSVSSRRLACKARGMGDSHTPANAFFDIPHDLMHGAVLACSHPECSGSGRRFRYCQVCEVPVAKRNFLKRHSHGLIGIADPSFADQANNASMLDDDDDGPYEETSDSNRRRSLSFDAAESLNQLSSNQHELKSVQDVIRDLDNNKDTHHESMRDVVRLNKQELLWLSLYHERPNFQDMEAAKRWMEKVFDLVQSSTSLPGKEIHNSECETVNSMAGSKTSLSSQAMVPNTEIGAGKGSFSDSFDALIEASMKTISGATGCNNNLNRIQEKNDVNTSNDKTDLTPGIFNFEQNETVDKSTSNSSNFPSDMQDPSHPQIEGPPLLTTYGTLNQSDNKPQTLADLILRRKCASLINMHKTLDNKDSGGGAGTAATTTAEEEMSQTSSVVTRQSLRRRPSIQNARQLMGKIKLSGLNENEMDQIF